MCGICGRLSFDDAPGERELILRMCSHMVHRGPDHEGAYAARSIALGERRLAIIDLRPEAAAPLANENGTVWVVFNGEIYNFRELRRELVERGHVFRTRTDSEVLVHLYEEYGTECVHRLRGMFGFAIWDAERGRLFGARDRLGKKPFFYARDERGLSFASELDALLQDPRISREPDYEALDAYLTLQYVPSPSTAFRAVRKLPAGHTLLCTCGGELSIQRYWSAPVAAEVRRPVPQLREELLARLREAVRIRLISDVPLGTLLSGGIDSSLVVALMAEASSRPVKTFSVGFTEQAFNELAYARLVAERYGTEHRELMVEPASLDVIPELVRHYGEPFGDSSALPCYHLARLARQHVTVALTGDGGDESFSGYEHYAQVHRWSRADRLPARVRRMLAAAVGTALQHAGPSGLAARVDRAAAMVAAELPDRYRLHVSIVKPQEKRALYAAGFLERAAGMDNGMSAQDGPPDPIRWMMWHDLQHYLPDCLMVKTDIAAMANSLELRSPLLDHELVEFAATLPRTLLRDGNGGKLLLRDVARPLLPAALFERRKMGFGVPLRAWFRGSLSDYLRAILLDPQAARRGLFQTGAIARLIDEHEHGKRDWSNRLWSLLMLELWFRQFEV